ncbi:MAG: hypothetical protein RLZ83_305, partial [Pseudomonadota bacterium]
MCVSRFVVIPTPGQPSGPIVVKFQRLDLELAPYQFLDLGHQPLVATRYQRDRQAGSAGAPGAA